MTLNPRIVQSEEVPERLRARLAEFVCRSPPSLPLAETLLAVAVDRTRELLDGPQTDRRTALDVLAVDALVTHALELMSEEPGTFEVRCRDALSVLSTSPIPS